ncbi:MAG: PEP-CTERM sorting domain-containing protein [Proteobacteria bacterium]|nr:PEP-CTERM sorting domain-containing protein [Pseudomonadota bacterium]
MRARLAGITAASGLALGALAFGAPQSAQAAQILNFSGACVDCSGQGAGTLKLTDGAAGPLTKSDFLGFTYKSNLVSFSISSSDVVAVMGSLDPNDLGKTYIDVLQLGGTGWEFTRNSDGSWSVSSDITHGQGRDGGGSGGGSGGGGGGGFSFTDDTPPQRVVDDFGDSSSLSIAGVSQDLAVAVPEPAAWALTIIGFGALGVSLRRRRVLAPA